LKKGLGGQGWKEHFQFIQARKTVSAEGQSRSAPGNRSAAAVVGSIRTCPYAVTQFLFRLTSHGLRNRWNPPSSLTLHVQQASNQLKPAEKSGFWTKHEHCWCAAIWKGAVYSIHHLSSNNKKKEHGFRKPYTKQENKLGAPVPTRS